MLPPNVNFARNFGIHRNSKVPSARVMKTWVNKFEETSSTVKKKGGSVKTVRTPQNIDAMRASFEQSPRRSVVRHSKKLCYVSRPLIHLVLHMLMYVLPCKCNCIIISPTFNFFNTEKSPDSLEDHVYRSANLPLITRFLTDVNHRSVNLTKTISRAVDWLNSI